MANASRHRRQSTLESLIDRIYDTALAPEGWPDTLDAIARHFYAGAAIIQGYDTPHRNHLFSVTTANIAQAEDEYVAHYHPIDPRLDWILRHPNESLFYDYRHIDEAGMRCSAYYDWFERYLGLRYYVAQRIANNATDGMLVSLQFSRAHGHVQPQEIDAFSKLRPHLLRAVRTTRVIEAADQQHNATREVLARVRVAMFMLDSRARLIHANAAGERLLARNDGLQLRAQRLCAADSHNAAILRNALCEALNEPAPRSCGPCEISLRRPSGAMPYAAMVIPQRRRPVFATAAHSGCAAIVLINDTGESGPVEGPLLRESFGLTPAEVGVCELLADGQRIDTLCECLGITQSTARTHIKRVLAKTGTHSQSELVALLARFRCAWH